MNSSFSIMDMQITTILLEQLFVFVILAALCHQRERVGVAPLTMSFCAVMFFGMLMSAVDIYAPLPWGGTFNVAQTAVYLPLLTVFLMVYITCGVLRAQRLLLGVMCAFLFYVYFVMLLRMQFLPLTNQPLQQIVELMSHGGMAAVNLAAVGNLISFFCIPMIYSAIPARWGRMVRVMSALPVALAAGMVPEIILRWINNDLAAWRWQGALTVLGLSLLLGIILCIYLMMLEKELPDTRSRTFDFAFAFFGSYSRVKELEMDLSNWENRYRVILHQTAEMVVMCDKNGKIQEVNIAAERILGGNNAVSLIGRNLFKMLENPEPAADLHSAAEGALSFNCVIGQETQRSILAATLSPIHLRDQLLLVLVARDITGEVTLAREKEELAEQLMHSQRLESLGMLAGGIAHDFNNCIHAIMGHADVAGMLYTGDPEKVAGHLQKISTIAEKAGKLTSQLLGFARKGKYHVVDIDLVQLLDESISLLDPFRVRGVDIRNRCPSGPVMIRGDQIQMQQVVLNLLINAVDATAENQRPRVIRLSAGNAENAPLKFTPTADHPGAAVEEYCYFSIEDNGSGMDENTRKKIFEPFFTTKPVGSGTGMGLAMVYGTVTHHRGWIQLESVKDEGTLFCFFFPKAQKNEGAV